MIFFSNNYRFSNPKLTLIRKSNKNRNYENHCLQKIKIIDNPLLGGVPERRGGFVDDNPPGK
jgi:hypothetical protein